jgi:methylenetetrahydrofolate dehydrogenase (NADP+) / methenyltetrahydrofolate cyclohydrolase
MEPVILDGKACAVQIRKEIARETAKLRTRPGLVVVLVGNERASRLYVSNKEKAALEVGFAGRVEVRSETVSQEELESLLKELNEDSSVHGYLVQLPLPKHIDPNRIVALIDPKKDVDGFTPVNHGLLLRGTPRIVPATPRGVVELLKRYGISLRGRRVVIVGRSTIVGRPLGALMLIDNATVTIAHSHTRDLKAMCREADVLVTAVGKPRFITREYVSPGAVIVDVGISSLDGKTCGDVDFESVREVASAITPVPGGIGPMTIAMLLQNTLEVTRSRS